MSLIDAMNTAVSGLSSQEWAIGNISNNIANSQTVGYKGVDTSFEALVFGNGQFQQPEAVEAQSVYTNNLSGSIVQSQQATSLAINGNGFFEVKGPPSGTANGVSSFDQTNFYSRRGDFQVNQYGYLVNGAGYTLEGYPVNAAGQPTASTASPIQIPQTEAAPTPSSLVSVLGSLPGSSTTAIGSTSQATATVYDSQGNAHTVDITFTRVTPSASNNNAQWTATISAPDDVGNGATTAGPSSVVLDLTYGTNGTLSNLALDSTSTGVGASGGVTLGSGTVEQATVTNAGANTPATVTIPWEFGAGNAYQSVTLNFGNFGTNGGLTDYGSTTQAAVNTSADGSGAGNLTGLAIDQNGYVNLTYSNGQTIKAFQVALAQFPAPDQLQSIDGSTFAQSTTSGAPLITAPGQQGAGTISPSALEQSNVNLSTQLTSLITAQQAYSSNAKVITTANQMIQTVEQLIQG